MNITIQAIKDEDGAGRIIISGESVSAVSVSVALILSAKTPVSA